MKDSVMKKLQNLLHRFSSSCLPCAASRESLVLDLLRWGSKLGLGAHKTAETGEDSSMQALTEWYFLHRGD